ncbi:MAG: glycosyltransferase family 9 protein [Deltaproteobacteria bacterium]
MDYGELRRIGFDLDGDPGPPIDPAGKHILLVYLFPALGDAVLLAPVARALLDAGAEVDVLLRPSGARIWRHVDLPVRVIEVGDPLDADYDVAVDLTRRFDADGRPHLARAPVRLGWMGEDEPNPPPGLTFGTVDHRIQADRHWSRLQMLPLRCFGVKEPIFDVPFRIDDAARAAADAMWTSKPRVLVVPGSREARKLWRPNAYAIAGGALREDGASLVVVGAPAEADRIEEVADRIGAPTYTGSDLGQLLALVQGADIVLTNDTGPLHLAYLSDVPTVAVFTQMPTVAWGPPHRTERHIVIRVDAAVEQASDAMCGDALANAVRALLARVES